ncbi:ABC transporter permease [Bacteroidota bacterium]
MFKNFVKIAIRNLVKQKFYSLLNIAGLAVGVACCLLIILFVQNELSYDTYHEKGERIYRIANKGFFGGQKLNFVECPPPLAGTLVRDYPEVETAIRFRRYGNFMIKYGDKNLKEEKFVFTDPQFFDIFSIPLIKGNPKTALVESNRLVLNERIAEKYFGEEDPIGKTVLVDNKRAYTVTGVCEVVPENTHFDFEIFASLNTLDESKEDMWVSQNFPTYLVLREGADPAELESKFPALLEKYMGPQIEQYIGITFAEFLSGGNEYAMYLQPIQDIHLYSHLEGEIGINSDVKYIYIFSAIAVFIMLIACINFMNLSTARSAGRAKEVGIRKVLGSFKKQLIWQFLIESMMLSVIALFLGFLLANLALPYFNNLADKQMELSLFGNPWIFASALFITLFVGLAAGSYPAFFISAFQPVAVLKGKIKSGTKSGLLRSSLVVFQFSASIILIVGTTVVYNQLRYIQSRELGYNKEHVVLINDAWLMGNQTDAFKEELRQNESIINATISGYLPVPSNRGSGILFPDANLNADITRPVQRWWIDYDYVSTLGLEIVKGRNFSPEFATDSMGALLNEAAVKHFNFGDDVIEKTIGRPGDNPKEIFSHKIVGVVKDFNFESMRETIKPVVLFFGADRSKIAVRIKPENISESISLIHEVWNKFAPGQPFDYTFMDEDFNNIYKKEQRLGNTFTIFALLAIFVGCLGLFGLAAYTTEQRTKEIGVRKVMGASTQGVVFLLSKEFGKLIIISFIISTPIAYLIMTRWLEDFAYRTDLSSTTFLFAGALAFVVAILTVSYHAIRAALSNPADSLRCE